MTSRTQPRTYLDRLWSWIEGAATVLGVASGVVWIWALIYPGTAIATLEAYQERFAKVEATIISIDDRTKGIDATTLATLQDTETLVQALPVGVRLAELYRDIDGCDATADTTTTIIVENNEKSMLSDAYVRLLDPKGHTVFEETNIFLNAEGVFFHPIPNIERASWVCIGALTDGAATLANEYEIVNWRATSDTCKERPDYGYRHETAALRRVTDPAAMRCQ